MSDELELAVIQHNARIIFAALLSAEIPDAVVVFSGGGDSGDIFLDKPVSMPEAVLEGRHQSQSLHRVWGRLEEGNFGYVETSVKEAEHSLHEMLCDVAAQVVYAKFGNWYDGDIRTHGQVRFDAVERTIVIDMTSYEPKEMTFSIEVTK